MPSQQDGGVIEGDATEIPGIDENPNAARRERAKKRKRKRRRYGASAMAAVVPDDPGRWRQAETFEALLAAG